MSGGWNLVDDVQQMWSLPFMVNAYRAGTLLAVLAALGGWVMVVRRQSFAGHALALVGFNVGVEIGQLCIVAAVLPLAWSLRGTRTYRGAFAAGSLAIAAVAALWLVQRAFDLSLIAG